MIFAGIESTILCRRLYIGYGNTYDTTGQKVISHAKLSQRSRIIFHLKLYFQKKSRVLVEYISIQLIFNWRQVHNR